MKIIELRRFRKEMGLSQIQLAEVVGYRQSFISDIEQRKRAVPDAFIEKLRDIFPEGNIESYIYDETYRNLPTAGFSGQGVDSKDLTLLKALEMLSKAQDETSKALKQFNEVLSENALLKVEIEKLKGENELLKFKYGIAR